MTEAFDLVVIGGGPAGYVAAIRAAQLGMKVACVEKRGSLGGTCLNVGCIPSKALLETSHHYEMAKKNFDKHGIKIKGSVEIDLPAMMKHKDEIVKSLTQGIEGLFKKNKITYLKGHAIILGKGEIAVKPVDGKGTPESIKTKNILIATGSDIVRIPNVETDEKRIVSSTGALALSEVPKKLILIGGGVIGLEMGSVWSRLGAEVTVVEYMNAICPGMDGEISRQFQKTLEKQGFKFMLSTKVKSAKITGKNVSVKIEPAAGGTEEELKADVVIVAVGRRPYTDNLGLKEAGIAVDEKGRIKVNGHFETNVQGIYAVGDVIAGPMLAHKAEEDGVAAVEIMAGQAGHVDYNKVPGVIYTWPEVATVGFSEEQLKEQGVQYKIGKFPFLANSRARAISDTEGFVKILADAVTDKVLGVHIIGPDAGTLIAEAVAVMEFGGASEDIARTCHAHPTLNEAVKEAALAVEGRVIHI